MQAVDAAGGVEVGSRPASAGRTRPRLSVMPTAVSAPAARSACDGQAVAEQQVVDGGERPPPGPAGPGACTPVA